MITHYDILRGQIGNGFESRVQERINVGWQPYGSPHYRTDRAADGINHQTTAIQAIVRYDNKENHLHATSPKLVPNDPRPAGA